MRTTNGLRTCNNPCDFTLHKAADAAAEFDDEFAKLHKIDPEDFEVTMGDAEIKELEPLTLEIDVKLEATLTYYSPNDRHTLKGFAARLRRVADVLDKTEKLAKPESEAA